MQRSLIGDTGEGMQDSFDILEERVKTAAELVRKLRRDNQGLEDQLKENKARLAEAEARVSALEEQAGDTVGRGANLAQLTAEIETMKGEQDEVRTRVARILALLESLD
jgi:predicted RNase H-like nuclease (RuvC/YqgF family)